MTDSGTRDTATSNGAAEEGGDTTFAALGLDAALVSTLAELGYEEPTPIQRAAIPSLLDGRDILAEAPTGTGKTAAFALPMLQRIARTEGRREDPAGHRRLRALVLVPTRELAIQVAEAVHRYGRPFDARVLPVYGGQAIGQQLRSLRRGVDVVVATPGRAVDHLRRGSLDLAGVDVTVLDEADEMLDMGFAEDLDVILDAVPPTRQTALFSATISSQIKTVARRQLRDPVQVTVPRERRGVSAPGGVRQIAYVVRRADKPPALVRILDLEDAVSVLVFARTRGEVDDLTERLAGHGHDAAALHGGLAQEQRDRVMGRFRDGALDVLVATDVAARGLDIGQVSHVVNYDIPSNPQAYVHRIGRTGRAGREGVAITLVEPREHPLLRNIERVMGARIQVGQLPTVADLRERRIEVLRATLREALLDDGLERYRAIVEPLAEEFDVVDVALAAVSVAADATSRDGEAEVDIPPARFFDDDRGSRRRPASETGWRPRDEGRRPTVRTGWARLWVGAGRRAGVRPADLVGAITREAGVAGNAVGAIQIADGFSVVEVAESAAEDVVRSLRGTTIRGRRVSVRRDREA